MPLPFDPLGGARRPGANLPFSAPLSPVSPQRLAAAGSTEFARMAEAEAATQANQMRAHKMAFDMEQDQRNERRQRRSQRQKAEQDAIAKAANIDVAKAEFGLATAPQTISDSERNRIESDFTATRSQIAAEAAAALAAETLADPVANETEGGFLGFGASPTPAALEKIQSAERFQDPNNVTDDDLEAYRAKNPSSFTKYDELRTKLDTDQKARDARTKAEFGVALAKARKSGFDPMAGMQPDEDPAAAIDRVQGEVDTMQPRIAELTAKARSGLPIAELQPVLQELGSLQSDFTRKTKFLETGRAAIEAQRSASQVSQQSARENAVKAPTIPQISPEVAKSAALTLPDGSYETTQPENLAALVKDGAKVFWKQDGAASTATPETRAAKIAEAAETIKEVKAAAQEMTAKVAAERDRLQGMVNQGVMTPEHANAALDALINSDDTEADKAAVVVNRKLDSAVRDFMDGQIDASTLDSILHAAGSPSTAAEVVAEAAAQRKAEDGHIQALRTKIEGDPNDPVLSGEALRLSKKISDIENPNFLQKWGGWLKSNPVTMTLGAIVDTIGAAEWLADPSLWGKDEVERAAILKGRLTELREASQKALADELTKRGVDLAEQPRLIARAQLEAVRNTDFFEQTTARGGLPQAVGEKLPFVGGILEANRLLPFAETAYKLEAGEEVEADEMEALSEFIRFAGQDQGFWTKVTETVTAMPAFVVELASTSGIASAVRTGGMQVLKQALMSAATKEGKERLVKASAEAVAKKFGKDHAKKYAAWRIGSGLAQEAVRLPFASAGRVAAEFTRDAAMDGVNLTAGEQGIVAMMDREGRKGNWHRFADATVDSLIENVSERSGAYITKLVPKAARDAIGKMSQQAKGKLLSAALVKSLVAANPGKPVGQIGKFLKGANIGGTFEEMGEERVGALLRDIYTGTTTGEWELTLPSAEDLAVELVAFTVPGAARGIQTNRHFSKLDNSLRASDSEFTARLDSLYQSPQTEADRLTEKIGMPVEADDLANATALVGQFEESDAVKAADRLSIDLLERSEKAIAAGDLEKGSRFRQRALQVNRSKGELLDGEVIRAVAATKEIADIRDAAMQARAQVEAMPDADPGKKQALTQVEKMERTADLAGALVKIAQGNEGVLTTAEREAIKPVKGTKPAVVIENGSTIITDSGIATLRNVAPAAATYVKDDETTRRQKLLSQSTAAAQQTPPASSQAAGAPVVGGSSPQAGAAPTAQSGAGVAQGAATAPPAVAAPANFQSVPTGRGIVSMDKNGDVRVRWENDDIDSQALIREAQSMGLTPTISGSSNTGGKKITEIVFSKGGASGATTSGTSPTAAAPQSTPAPSAQPGQSSQSSPTSGKTATPPAADKPKTAKEWRNDTRKRVVDKIRDPKTKAKVARVVDAVSDALEKRGNPPPGGIVLTEQKGGSGVSYNPDTKAIEVNVRQLNSQVNDEKAGALDDAKLADWMDRIASEEMTHFATVEAISFEEAAAAWKKLGKSKAGRKLQDDALRTYNAAYEQAGKAAPKLGDARSYYELLRMAIQNTDFRQRITEAAFAEPGIKADLLAFLQRIADILAQRIAALPKAARAALEGDLAKVRAAMDALGIVTDSGKPAPAEAVVGTQQSSDTGTPAANSEKAAAGNSALVVVQLKDGRAFHVRKKELDATGATVRAFTWDGKPIRGDAGAIPRSEIVTDAEPTPVDDAANEAATSPTNDKPEPTDAQKKAEQTAPVQAPLEAKKLQELKDALAQLERWREPKEANPKYAKYIGQYEAGTWSMAVTASPEQTLRQITEDTNEAKRSWAVSNMEALGRARTEMVNILSADKNLIDMLNNNSNQPVLVLNVIERKIQDILSDRLTATTNMREEGKITDHFSEKLDNPQWLESIMRQLRKLEADKKGIRPVPGAESSAIAKDDPQYPYKFEGWASTNEGGRLAVKAGGNTAKEAADNAMRLLSERWHEREARQAGKSPTAPEPTPTTREAQQKAYEGFKRALNKAEKAKDWQKVIEEADRFDAYYSNPENGGYPDQWSRWERAKEDAQQKLGLTPPLVAPITRPLVDTPPAVSEAEQKAADAMRENLKGLFSAPRPTDAVLAANRTARSAGAVGAKAITPRYVAETTEDGDTVLNFGAGKPDKSTGRYLHSDMVAAKGAIVREYDFGQNSTGSLGRRYDTVFASNVLNVQADEAMLRDTLRQIKDSMTDGGRAVFNFPESPRYLSLEASEVEAVIADEIGEQPRRVGGSKRAPLWEVGGDRSSLASAARPTAEWRDEDIPEDRIPGIMQTTKLVIDAGVRTPEDFAAFMERTFPGGGSRPYVSGIWQIMGGMRKELRTATIPDWQGIYAGIDETAEMSDDSTEEQPNDATQQPGDGGTTDSIRSEESAGDGIGQSDLQDVRGSSGAEEGTGTGATGQPDGGGRGDGERGSTSGSGTTAGGPTNQQGEAGTDSGSGIPDSGEASSDGVRKLTRPPEGSPEANFVIGDDFSLPSGPKARIDANLRAIRLLREIEKEERDATAEEKAILAKYSGWGSFKNAFNQTNQTRWERIQARIASSGYGQRIAIENTEEYRELAAWRDRWGSLHDQLTDLLEPEEFRAMSKSILNAHYTSLPIIDSMWKIVDRLGFKGGKVLETSAGGGYFVGRQPKRLADKSEWNAVELDEITSRIFAKLYPEARINGEPPNAARRVNGLGFQQSSIPNNSIDLVIGNFPFDDLGPNEATKEFGMKMNLHNYFFARSLDKVRPGGLVVAITSASTMDNNLVQRELLAGRAELVAAIRLPNTAFKDSAGTEVTTDIIILRKKDGSRDVGGQAWLNTAPVGTDVVTVKSGNKNDPYDYLSSVPAGWVPVVESLQEPWAAWRAGRPRSGERWKNLVAALRSSGNTLMDDIQFTAPIEVNQYFENNPSMVMGKHTLAGTMYSAGEYAVAPNDGNLIEQIEEAIERLPENVFGENVESELEKYTAVEAQRGDREGSTVMRDGKVYQVIKRQLVPVRWDVDILENIIDGHAIMKGNKALRAEFNAASAELDAEDLDKYLRKLMADRLPSSAIADIEKKIATEITKRTNVFASWVQVRDAARALVNAELDNLSEEKTEELRQKLNEAYDAHVAKFSAFGKRGQNVHRFLEDDEDTPLLDSLEDEELVSTNEKGKPVYRYVKRPIFFKAQLSKTTAPDSAESIEEAVGISLGYLGRLSVPYMAKLMSTSENEVVSLLNESGLALVNPKTGLYEDADMYLSGEVRTKLREAEKANLESGGQYTRNIELLKSVMPANRPIQSISVNMGARWVPGEVYTQFAREVLGLSQMTIAYQPAANIWRIEEGGSSKKVANTSQSQVAEDSFETNRVSVGEIIDSILNKRQIAVYDNIGRGQRAFNSEATIEAKAKADSMADKFNEWVKSSDSMIEVEGEELRVGELAERLYNENVAGVVPPNFKGDWVTLPGQSGEIWLKKHRKAVLARMLTLGYGMMAHGVGSGKTYNQIALAMELRRLGKARKVMTLVQNSTIKQFAASHMKAYPQSRILVADEKNFTARKRAKFQARIATGDYDSIILTHSNVALIGHDEQAIRNYMARAFDQLTAALADAEDGSTEQRDIQKAMDKLQEKLDKMLKEATSRAGGLLTWEQLGIDALIVDEAHAFKNAPIVTRMARVKNLPNGEGSAQAIMMQMKVANVQATTGGKNIFFATGTPITNTMAEAYTMLNFIAPTLLEQRGIKNFDDFATTFGRTVSEPEATWKGEIENVERFAKFINGPELVNLIRSVFDVALGNDSMGIRVPKIKGGKPKAILIEPTEASEIFNDWIIDTAAAFAAIPNKKKAFEEDPWLSAIPIMTMQAGMAQAIDPRLINPNVPDDPDSKVNRAVDEVVRIYKQGHKNRTAQVIFSDLSNPFSTMLLREFNGDPFAEYGTVSGEMDRLESQLMSFQGKKDLSPEETKEKSRLVKAYSDLVGKQFNLFEDIKAKLVAKGIPAAEIAIASSDMDRKKLQASFEKVNSGQIRIIMGSTARLGVGVNIQERLAACHNISPPRDFKPAMMEQRIGRIERQGNLHRDWADTAFIQVVEKHSKTSFEGKNLEARYNAAVKWLDKNDDNSGRGVRVRDLAEAAAAEFDVEVINYGLKLSMDSAVYSMMNAKQGFIEQVLMGENVLDEFDDPASEEAAGFALMAAEAMGNEDLKTKVILDGDLKKLRALRAGFLREQWNRKSSLESARSRIERYLKKDPAAIRAAGADFEGAFSRVKKEHKTTRGTKVKNEIGIGAWQALTEEQRAEKITELHDAPVFRFGGEEIDMGKAESRIVEPLNKFVIALHARAVDEGRTVTDEIFVNDARFVISSSHAKKFEDASVRVETPHKFPGGDSLYESVSTYTGNPGSSLLQKLRDLTEVGLTERYASSIENQISLDQKTTEELEKFIANQKPFPQEAEFIEKSTELVAVQARLRAADTNPRNHRYYRAVKRVAGEANADAILGLSGGAIPSLPQSSWDKLYIRLRIARRGGDVAKTPEAISKFIRDAVMGDVADASNGAVSDDTNAFGDFIDDQEGRGPLQSAPRLVSPSQDAEYLAAVEAGDILAETPVYGPENRAELSRKFGIPSALNGPASRVLVFWDERNDKMGAVLVLPERDRSKKPVTEQEMNDRRYLALVESYEKGNPVLLELQRMVDEAAKAAGGPPRGHVYAPKGSAEYIPTVEIMRWAKGQPDFNPARFASSTDPLQNAVAAEESARVLAEDWSEGRGGFINYDPEAKQDGFQSPYPTVVRNAQGKPTALSERFKSTSNSTLESAPRLFASARVAKKYTAAQARQMLAGTRMISTRAALDALGQYPEYLDTVAAQILAKRDTLLQGKLTVRDVAKAYILTQGSIGSDSRPTATIMPDIRSAGLNQNSGLDPLTLFQAPDGSIRPEEITAWWLGTPLGQEALNDLEQGKVNQNAFEQLATVKRSFGKDNFKLNSVTGRNRKEGFQWLEAPDKGQFSLTNVEALTQAINDTKGDPQKLERTLLKINGISHSKKGFIGHMLGMGTMPTTDAVEYNFWLTGQGEGRIANLPKVVGQTLEALKENQSSLNEEVYRRISTRIKELGKELGKKHKIDPEVLPHILHHWIWDKAKGIQTTHRGMYQAMSIYAGPRLGIDDPDFIEALDYLNEQLPSETEREDLLNRAGFNWDRTFTEDELRQAATGVRFGLRSEYDERRDKQTHEAWNAEAAEMLRDNRAGVIRDLVATAAAGEAIINPVQVKASQLLLPSLTMRALAAGDRQAMRDAEALTWAYDIAGTQTARGLAARWQPHKTPEEIHRELLAKAIFTPSKADRDRAAKAPTPSGKRRRIAEMEAEIERIKTEAQARERSLLEQVTTWTSEARQRLSSLRRDTSREIKTLREQLQNLQDQKDSLQILAEANDKRLKQIEEAFKEMGVTFHDLFVSKEAVVALRTSSMVKNVLSQFNEKERLVTKMRMEAKTDRHIAKKLNISKTAVEAINERFNVAFKAQAREWVKRGFSAADLDGSVDIAELIDEKGNLLSAARPTLTDAEIDAKVDEIFRVVVPSEEARATGALKRMSPEAKEGEFGFDLSRPEHAAMLMRAIQRLDATGMDMIYEYWINGLLSGPATHMANIAGNTGNAAWEYAVQRPVEMLVNSIITRDAAGAQFSEVQSMAKYLGLATSTAIRYARIVWQTEVSLFDPQWLNKPITIGTTSGDKGQVQRFAIKGTKGRMIRLPSRALAFADEFAKHLFGMLEAAAQAHRLAKAEGRTGADFDARVDRLVKTPGSPAWLAAVDKAHTITFTSELPGPLQKAQDILHERAKTPWGAAIKTFLRFLFPFVRTPYNIFATGLRKTPLGTLRMAGKGIAAYRGNEPFFDSYPKAAIAADLAEQMLAWTATMLLIGIAEGDPDDDKKTLLITGSRSMADNRGEDQMLSRMKGGETTILWKGKPILHYGRYEPFATMITTVVDAARNMKAMGQGRSTKEAFDQTWRGFLNQARSKTFLQGLEGLMSMIEGHKNLTDSAVKAVAQGAVPNLIRQPVRAMDDYARDSRNAPWYYQAFPAGGLAEPLFDLYGRPIEKAGGPISRMLVSVPQKQKPIVPADRAMSRFNLENPNDAYYPQQPTKSMFRYKVPAPGLDKKGRPNAEWKDMTPQQAAAFRKRAGQQFTAAASTIFPFGAGTATPAQMAAIETARNNVQRETKATMFPGRAPAMPPRKSPTLAELFGQRLRQ